PNTSILGGPKKQVKEKCRQAGSRRRPESGLGAPTRPRSPRTIFLWPSPAPPTRIGACRGRLPARRLRLFLTEDRKAMWKVTALAAALLSWCAGPAGALELQNVRPLY